MNDLNDYLISSSLAGSLSNSEILGHEKPLVFSIKNYCTVHRAEHISGMGEGMTLGEVWEVVNQLRTAQISVVGYVYLCRLTH